MESENSETWNVVPQSSVEIHYESSLTGAIIGGENNNSASSALVVQ